MDFSVPLRGQFRYLSQLLRINQQLSGCSGNLTIPHQCVVIIIIILNEFVKGKMVKVKEQIERWMPRVSGQGMTLEIDGGGRSSVFYPDGKRTQAMVDFDAQLALGRLYYCFV